MTPKGRTRSQPQATDRKTRSSERAVKSKELKVEREAVASSRALEFPDKEEEGSSGLPEGDYDM